VLIPRDPCCRSGGPSQTISRSVTSKKATCFHVQQLACDECPSAPMNHAWLSMMKGHTCIQQELLADTTVSQTTGCLCVAYNDCVRYYCVAPIAGRTGPNDSKRAQTIHTNPKPSQTSPPPPAFYCPLLVQAGPATQTIHPIPKPSQTIDTIPKQSQTTRHAPPPTARF
jgi:hypothetical protein